MDTQHARRACLIWIRDRRVGNHLTTTPTSLYPSRSALLHRHLFHATWHRSNVMDSVNPQSPFTESSSSPHTTSRERVTRLTLQVTAGIPLPAAVFCENPLQQTVLLNQGSQHNVHSQPSAPELTLFGRCQSRRASWVKETWRPHRGSTFCSASWLQAESSRHRLWSQRCGFQLRSVGTDCTVGPSVIGASAISVSRFRTAGNQPFVDDKADLCCHVALPSHITYGFGCDTEYLPSIGK